MIKFLVLKISTERNIIIEIIPTQKYHHCIVRNINKFTTKISLFLLLILLFSIVIVLLLRPYGCKVSYKILDS